MSTYARYRRVVLVPHFGEFAFPLVIEFPAYLTKVILEYEMDSAARALIQ